MEPTNDQDKTQQGGANNPQGGDGVTPSTEPNVTNENDNGGQQEPGKDVASVETEETTEPVQTTAPDDFAVQMHKIMQLPADQQPEALAKLGFAVPAMPQVTPQPAPAVQAVAVAPTAPVFITSFAALQSQSLPPQQEFDALVGRKEYLWSQISAKTLYHLTDQWNEIGQIDARLNVLWNSGNGGVVRKEDK